MGITFQTISAVYCGKNELPVVVQARGGAEHHQYGDPYQYIATVVLSGCQAHVSGLAGAFGRSEFVELRDEIKRQFGIKGIHYERSKGAFVPRKV